MENREADVFRQKGMQRFLGIPLEPTTTFSTKDPEVIVHIRFENLSGKHVLRWDWHSPSGEPKQLILEN